MTEGIKLPSALTATPAQVAKDIWRAFKKNKDVIYTRWMWRWIMFIIKNIPEFIFKKLKL
jgi:short-subunit dehydrogenase